MTASLFATTLRINTGHADARRELRDVCAMHSRIIDMTLGMPDGGPRVLWAQPEPDVLVVRAPEPVVAARLPAGWACEIAAREWTPPTTPGTWQMVAALNPARHHSNLDAENKRRNYAPKLLDEPDDQAAWLRRRLCAGGRLTHGDQPPSDAAHVLDYRVTRRYVARGAHRIGKQITARIMVIAATVEVADPVTVAAAVIGGIGIDKTWGAGLTLWRAL